MVMLPSGQTINPNHFLSKFGPISLSQLLLYLFDSYYILRKRKYTLIYFTFPKCKSVIGATSSTKEKSAVLRSVTNGNAAYILKMRYKTSNE